MQDDCRRIGKWRNAVSPGAGTMIGQSFHATGQRGMLGQRTNRAVARRMGRVVTVCKLVVRTFHLAGQKGQR